MSSDTFTMTDTRAIMIIRAGLGTGYVYRPCTPAWEPHTLALNRTEKKTVALHFFFGELQRLHKQCCYVYVLLQSKIVLCTIKIAIKISTCTCTLQCSRHS